METKGRILGLTSGGLQGFSGANKGLFNSISKKYEVIDVIDNKLSGFWKYYNVMYCFLKSPQSAKYFNPLKEIYSGDIAYYRFRNMIYVNKRTEAANKILKKYNKEYDVIIQTGWIPAIREKNDISRCIYTDYTMKLSEKENPIWSMFFSEKDKNQWIEMETQSYKNSDIIFTMSEHTRESIIEDYGVAKNKVVAIYGGINVDNFTINKSDYSQKIILFVGIDFERKGGYVLLDAYKIVKKEITNANLIILGSKPDINIEGVHVKGFVSQEEKDYYYNTASLFVMPSLAEPFGLVFLEAMAHKLPCIGTTVSAIPEIIKDGENGYLVEPNNPAILADKIISLLKDENLCQIMGNKGCEMAEKKFTWEKVVERMSIELDKLI